MDQTLNNMLDQVESKKSEIIQRTLATNEAYKIRPPIKGGWSPAQVVEHLIILLAVDFSKIVYHQCR